MFFELSGDCCGKFRRIPFVGDIKSGRSLRTCGLHSELKQKLISFFKKAAGIPMNSLLSIFLLQ